MTEKDNLMSPNNSIQQPVPRLFELEKKAESNLVVLLDRIQVVKKFHNGDSLVDSATSEKVRNCVMVARQLKYLINDSADQMMYIIHMELKDSEHSEDWLRKTESLVKQAADGNKEMFKLAAIIAEWCDVTFPKPSLN